MSVCASCPVREVITTVRVLNGSRVLQNGQLFLSATVRDQNSTILQLVNYGIISFGRKSTLTNTGATYFGTVNEGLFRMKELDR